MVNQLAKLTGILLMTAALSLFPLALFALEPPGGGAPALATAGSPFGAADPQPITAAARQPSLPGERPLESLLGMTLAEAAAFGPPAEVFPVRGRHPWEDDVAFYYPDHSYLFWFQDRVWEVRVDRRFTGTAIGVRMGESTAQVEKVLGKPFYTGTQSEIFILPNRGFPVRARLFFTDDRLSDLYVYRGDF